MHVAAVRHYPGLKTFEIIVEVGERMVFELARSLTQLLELGQRVDRRQALVDEAALGVGERLLQLDVLQSHGGPRLEGMRIRFHVGSSPSAIANVAISARISAT